MTILPAEYAGEAAHDEKGILTIGTGDKVVKLHLQCGQKPGWWNTGTVSVWIRRWADDLSIAEIHMAKHDGYAQEELDMENEEAERYPLGPKEYWRNKIVGKWTTGEDGHLVTNEEFEADWLDNQDDDMLD
jgi:hypothetical protein